MSTTDEDVTTQADPATEPGPARKKRGGFGKLLMLLLPILLIGGGGWFLLGGGDKAEAQEVAIAQRGMASFETFLVNLSDPGGNRFLKVTLQLVFASVAEAKAIADSAAVMGHLRSAILELLTEQQAPALVTADGKTKLKDAIKAGVTGILKKQKVIDVLFSEFVVQF